jgi:glutamate-1-semialdehyde 2,1-aminomutase
MRAGLRTLERMTELDGWDVLDARAAVFCDDLGRRLAAVSPELGVTRHASIFWIHHQLPRSEPARAPSAAPIRRPDRIPPSLAPWYERFFHAALARGVYLPPSPYEVCFLSMAHDGPVLDAAADALVAAAAHASRG